MIAVNESVEEATANEPASQAIWAQFADHLTAQPDMHGFDVIVNWSN